MMPDSQGLMAIFPSEDSFLAALRLLREQGFVRIEAFTPYPLDYPRAAWPRSSSPIPWVMLGGGLSGALGGFYLQWYAAHDFPLNVGGRPLASWPSFVPITFELTVLCAAISGLLALFFLAGLPRLDHPLFSDSRFARASQDRFVVWVRADDPQYSEARLRQILSGSEAETLTEVLP